LRLLDFRALLDRSRSAAFFEKIAAQGDLMELRLAGTRAWLVSDPALAREVLVEHGHSVG
jgi:cytochrome P450